MRLLDSATPIVYGIVAVTILLRWRRVRDTASAWAAAMFTVLALVIGIAQLVDVGSGDASFVGKVLIAAFVLFPYMLFRFAATLLEPGRLLHVGAGVVTAVASLSIFLFDDLSSDGEDVPASFAAYTFFVIAYWVGLSGLVAFWFWRGGRGRPTVVRLRMRTLSVAATVAATALVLQLAGSDTDETGPLQAMINLLAVVAGPFFLVGFAPPAWLLARWRRSDESALREAEAALVAAHSPSEVAESLLPYVARTMGGDASFLTAPDGSVVAHHGISAASAAALVDTTASAGIARAAFVTSVEMRSGRLYVAGDRFTPYFGREEYHVLARLADLTDVALRRSLVTEAEMQNAAELQRANDAMREFVAVASHDLRTPIAVVKGYAETMLATWETLGDEDKVTYIQTIARQADRLSRIVTDLLTTSQLDAGAVETQPELIDLRELVDEVLSDLGQDAVVEVDRGTLVHVDEGHAERIVRNLVENARFYGEPPIDVTAMSTEDAVELRVRDHGAGVPETFIPRLFERFARANTSASKSKHGTGLGLAIVQGLARLEGGDAWYEPASPGACFVVRFVRGEVQDR